MDGLISTVAAALAAEINPGVRDYLIAGKIVGEKSAKDANENELGLMMAGGVINNE